MSTMEQEDDDFFNDSSPENDNLPQVPLPKTAESSMSSRRHLAHLTHRIVLGVDYGTTYTGVAWATPGSNFRLDEIDLIVEWDRKTDNQDKVPSVISFSDAKNGEEQWGYDIGDESVAMINTKLELDVQDTKADELELTLQVLDGMKNLDFWAVRQAGGSPDFTWKGADDVATEYLAKVYEVVKRELEQLPEESMRAAPVDIVITVPAQWSYRAKNSTFRAIQKAGFNKANFLRLENMLMVTEPEAAALYTARRLQDQHGEQFLKNGECFVLVDAGGGTVDLISYRVVQLVPTLQLQKVGFATSAKCGSSYINTNFKKWLRWHFGPEKYQILDPNCTRKIIAHSSEGKLLRQIMKEFEKEKRRFCRARHNTVARIAWPKDLDHLQSDEPVRMQQGSRGIELCINYDEMKSFFDGCVDRIVELIKGQMEQIDKEKRKLRNVLLVGGFAESPHLQEEIKVALRLRKIVLRQPDFSWSAVVRGSVLYGVEKANTQQMQRMHANPKNLGFMLNEYPNIARNQPRFPYSTTDSIKETRLCWPVLKGDLILSNEPLVVEKKTHMPFTERGPRKFPIFGYDFDDEVPATMKHADELNTLTTLEYDLSDYDIDQFDRFNNNGHPFHVATTTCKLTVTKENFTAELIWNDGNKDIVLASDTIAIAEKKSGPAPASKPKSLKSNQTITSGPSRTQSRRVPDPFEDESEDTSPLPQPVRAASDIKASKQFDDDATLYEASELERDAKPNSSHKSTLLQPRIGTKAGYSTSDKSPPTHHSPSIDKHKPSRGRTYKSSSSKASGQGYVSSTQSLASEDQNSSPVYPGHRFYRPSPQQADYSRQTPAKLGWKQKARSPSHASDDDEEFSSSYRQQSFEPWQATLASKHGKSAF